MKFREFLKESIGRKVEFDYIPSMKEQEQIAKKLNLQFDESEEFTVHWKGSVVGTQDSYYKTKQPVNIEYDDWDWVYINYSLNGKEMKKQLPKNFDFDFNVKEFEKQLKAA